MSLRRNPILITNLICLEVLLVALIGYGIYSIRQWSRAVEPTVVEQKLEVREKPEYRPIGDATPPAANPDSDGDSIPDSWETEFVLNPNDASDANSDFDLDGLTAAQEYQLHTQSGGVSGNPLGKWSIETIAPPAGFVSTPSVTLIECASNGIALFNVSGQLSGTSSATSYPYTFNPSTGGWTRILAPTGFQSVGYMVGLDINSKGQVVGYFHSNGYKGFVWSPAPGGGASEIYSLKPSPTSSIPAFPKRISDTGLITGNADSLDGRSIAAELNGREVITPGLWGEPTYHDVNDYGEFIGSVYNPMAARFETFLVAEGYPFFSTGIEVTALAGTGGFWGNIPSLDPASFVWEEVPSGPGGTRQGTAIDTITGTEIWVHEALGAEFYWTRPGDEIWYTYPGFSEVFGAVNDWGEFAGQYSASLSEAHIFEHYEWLGTSFYDTGVYFFDGDPHATNARPSIYGISNDPRILIGTPFAIWSGTQVVPVSKLVPPGTSTNFTRARIADNGHVYLQESSPLFLLTPNQDADGDGMPDDWEVLNGLDATSPLDSFVDSDGDGTSNLGEFLLGTNPKAAPAFDSNGNEIDLRPGIDTDGDGIPNVWEWQNGMDYEDPGDAVLDFDRDGYSNLKEFELGTDPRGAPSYLIDDVGPLHDVTDVSFYPSQLGEGLTLSHSSHLVGDNLTETLFFTASPVSPANGGHRPHVWSRSRSADSGALASYTSHGNQTTSPLAISPWSAVFAEVIGSAGSFVYWNSPTVQASHLGGEGYVHNLTGLRVNKAKISRNGRYVVAAVYPEHDPDALEWVIWKMPLPWEEPSNHVGPVSLAIPGGDLWVDPWSGDHHVSDTGCVVATGHQNGSATPILWELNQAGTAVAARVLPLPADGVSGSVVGISSPNGNQGPPLVAGTVTIEGGGSRATAWRLDGTIINLGTVPGGGDSVASAISPGGTVGGFSKVVDHDNVIKCQAFVATVDPYDNSPSLQVQGPALGNITINSINDAGEMFGTDNRTSPVASFVPCIWRHGQFHLLDSVLPPASGYTLSRVISMNGDGTLFAAARKDGALSHILLIPWHDTDGDGMPDSFESEHGFNPYAKHQDAADSDGDGLSDLAEFRSGTDPRAVDTDRDGMKDGWEVAYGLLPLDPADAGLDPDGDYVTNFREHDSGTCPTGIYSLDMRLVDTEESRPDLKVGSDNGSFLVENAFVQEVVEDYNGSEWSSHINESIDTRLFPSWTDIQSGTIKQVPGYAAESVWGSTESTFTGSQTVPEYWIDSGAGVANGFVQRFITVSDAEGRSDLSEFFLVPDAANRMAESSWIRWEDVETNLRDHLVANSLPPLGETESLMPYADAVSDSGNLRVHRSSDSRVFILDEYGNYVDEIPPGPSGSAWGFINSLGKVGASKHTVVPADQGHLRWDIVTYFEGVQSTIEVPLVGASSLAVVSVSDDDKVLLGSSSPGPQGASLRGGHLLDLKSGQMAKIREPGKGYEVVVALSSSEGRMLGLGPDPFQITPDGSCLVLSALRIKGGPGAADLPLSSFALESIVANHVSSKGRITASATNAAGQSVIFQLNPILDSDNNGISDDYEAEIRVALAAAGKPLSPGQGVNGNVDYDGDGLTLFQEMRLGTSDSGTSRPGALEIRRDKDDDGVPDSLDADPFDEVIDWEKGPAPSFIVKPIAGTSETSRFIDVDSGGRVLFQEDHTPLSAYKFSSSPTAQPVTLETHNDNNRGRQSSEGQLYEECQPLGIMGASGDVFGEARFTGTPEYPAVYDPGFEERIRKLRPPGLVSWSASTSGGGVWEHTNHTPGTYGAGSFFGPQGSRLTFYANLEIGESTLDAVKYNDQFLPSHVAALPEIGIVEAAGVEGTGVYAEAFLSDTEFACSAHLSVSGAESPGSSSEGIGIWSHGAGGLQAGDWYKDEYFAGRNCYRQMELRREFGTDKRKLLFTTEGLRVGGLSGRLALSNLTLNGEVKGISRQGWILYETRNAIQPQPYLWVNGRSYALNAFVEEGFAVLRGHEIAENGLVCATIVDISSGGIGEPQLAILAPYEIDSKTSTSSVAGSQAPSAPPEFRKVSMAGRPFGEGKPQEQAEIDLPGEETHVDAYTRVLRHDTSHVYAPVPASELALQVTMSVDNSPVSIPSSVLATSAQVQAAGMSLGQHAKEVRDRVESEVARELGPFGLGWTTNLGCKVEVRPTGRKPRPGEQSLGSEIFTGYEVTVIDESGATHEFATFDLQNFSPKPSLVPNPGDMLKTLVRTVIDGEERLVFSKKYGTAVEFAWSGAIPPNDFDIPGPLENDFLPPGYKAYPVAVKDRHGNRVRFDAVSGVAGSMWVEGREGLKVQVKTKNLAGGQGHRAFRLVESITDARGSITRFNYRWINAMGALLPVLAESVKADGSKTIYTYESRLGQPVDKGDEFSRQSLAGQLGSPLHEIRDTNQKQKYEIDLSDPRMLSVYLHVNLKGVSTPGGGAYTFEYEPTPSSDLVKVHYSVKVNDPTGELSIGDLQSLEAEKTQELLSQVKEDFASRGGMEVAAGVYQLPAMAGADVVKGVQLPDGSRMTISTEETFEVPSQTPGTLGITVDPSFPLSGVTKRPNVTLVKHSSSDWVTRYEFGDLLSLYEKPDGQSPPGFPRLQNSTDPGQPLQAFGVTYTSLKITRGPETGDPGETATYTFDPEACMALVGTLDHSGNSVSYTYDDPIGVAHSIGRRSVVALPSEMFALPSEIDDPLGTTDAFVTYPDVTGEVRGGVSKSFTYDSTSRLMTSVVDGRGNLTETKVENGLRMEEKSYEGSDPNGVLVSWTKYDYDAASQFPSFVRKKTVKALGSAGDPGWVGDLVTEYESDAMGRVHITRVVSASGPDLETEALYDAAGNKTAERDPAGRWTHFGYDSVGRLIAVTYPDSSKTVGYDLAGRKNRETDERGHSTLWEYDSMSRVVKTARDMNRNRTIDSADLVTRTRYNAAGLPFEAIDPNGNKTVTHYDELHRVQETVNAEGGVTLFDYSGENSGSGLLNGPGYQPTRIRDPRGYLTIKTFDKLYRQTGERREFRLPDGMTEAQVAASWLDRSGGAGGWTLSETDYDDNGNVEETRVWRSGSLGPQVTVSSHDALNRVFFTTAASGTDLANSTRTHYTSTGLPWKVIAAEGLSTERVTETEHDDLGRPVKVWGPHPDTGLVVKEAPPGGTASPMTETRYDEAGNVDHTIDARDNRTDFDYDVRNRLVQTLAPEVTDFSQSPPVAARPRTYTEYDVAGNVYRVTGPRGDVTENEYDAANRVIRTTVALGLAEAATTETQYDKNGNVICVQDANLNRTRNHYDKLNRLIASAVNPDTGNPSANFGAPAAGDIVVVNNYDAGGNLIRVGDGMAAKTFNGTSWDLITTAGHVTGFSYDGLGRKVSQTWDIGSSVAKESKWEFDALVETASVDARNQRIEKEYDALLRPVRETHVGRPADTKEFSYLGAAPFVPGVSTPAYLSGSGPLVAVWHPHAAAERELREVFYTYDRAERVVTETSAGETHQYWYDIAGNRTLVTYANTGRSLVSKYDALGRVYQIIDTTNSVSDPISYEAAPSDLETVYHHDLAGSVVRKTLPNGNYTEASFDLRGRVLVSTTRKQSNEIVSKIDHAVVPEPGMGPAGYDAVGNVLLVEETYAGLPKRQVINIYDKTYRLATEIDLTVSTGEQKLTSYGYDPANNRVSKTVQEWGETAVNHHHVFGTPALGFNTNQLIGTGKPGVPNPANPADFKVRYTYDANGNRATKTADPSEAEEVVDFYSYDYQNRLVRLDVNAGQSSVSIHQYSYDYRTRRTKNDAAGDLARLSFSGGQSVQEYGSSSATVPVVETIRGSDMGGGVGGVLYTNEGLATAIFNHYNSRGDVISQSNGSGGVEWEAKYEAFGTRTAEDGAPVGRQRANTKDEDVTGLLNEGYRYRDLDAGVFITRDPAGFVDGPNVYSYVRQNPWSAFDPDGLDSVKMSWNKDSNTFEVSYVNEGVIWDDAPNYVGTLLESGMVDLGNGRMTTMKQIKSESDSWGSNFEEFKTSNRTMPKDREKLSGLRGGILKWKTNLEDAQGRELSPDEFDDVLTGTDIMADSVDALLWFYATAPIEVALTARSVKAMQFADKVDLSYTPQKGVAVLGHYPAYSKMANKLQAKRFEVPLEHWNKLDEAGKWAANQKFLDRQADNGVQFKLATPLDKVREDSFYEKELRHLMENRGYIVDGDMLIPGK